MIPLLALLALTVVPVNDPLAPLQLLHAEVTTQGKELRVCVKVRNESPQAVDRVQITGSIRDTSQSITTFFAGATPITSQERGVKPGGEFTACSSIPGAAIHKDAVIQITIR